ncbi:MAG: V-type ATP synthase subunit F [Candidatus Odinarchaeota archaeon]|nr:V-type ATP synthase subunit F [Candidatus Odinarchaeota archaeon]
MKVAVIGDPTFVRGFELIGCEGFITEDVREIKRILTELIESRDYAVIILPERFVDDTWDIRSKVIKSGQVGPLFAFLPDYTGISGKRLEELKRKISLAVGIKLKL